MSRWPLIACWIAAALAFAADAGAQTKNRFAVGANFNTTIATDAQNDGGNHVGFQWRLGHSDSGWAWKFGFNWYSTEVGATIDGHPVALGQLQVRPIMVGYGYTRTIRKLAVSTNVLGGYAFNGFSLADKAGAFYRGASGTQQVSTGARNTMVLFPEVSMWRDLNERVGLNISGGCLMGPPPLSLGRMALGSRPPGSVRPVVRQARTVHSVL